MKQLHCYFILICHSYAITLNSTLFTNKFVTVVKDGPKSPFSIATTQRCRGVPTHFPGLLYFTLDPYLIILWFKQGGIKYQFFSFSYDSTWDWTQASRAIAEHSNQYANDKLFSKEVLSVECNSLKKKCNNSVNH